jgi:hypothetical protein
MDSRRRFARQPPRLSPPFARLSLPLLGQRQRGGPVGQARAAPDLFARFDAGEYGDPAFAPGWTAHGGLGQVQQISRDSFGGRHVFHYLKLLRLNRADPAVLRTLRIGPATASQSCRFNGCLCTLCVGAMKIVLTRSASKLLCQRCSHDHERSKTADRYFPPRHLIWAPETAQQQRKLRLKILEYLELRF